MSKRGAWPRRLRQLLDQVADDARLVGAARAAAREDEGAARGSGRLRVHRPRQPTRSTYSPVRVSTRMRSPSFTKSGTCTMAPVSIVAGLVTFDAVSPLMPGSQRVILASMKGGSSMLIGLRAPEEHVDLLVLLQELLGVADLGLRERELLEGLRIHEHQVLAVPVEVLHLVLLDVRLVHLLARAEAAVDRAAVLQVAHLGAHEGAALAGLHVLEADDRVGLAVELDLESISELSGIHGHAALAPGLAGARG